MAELYKLSKYVLEELRANRIDKATVISLIKRFNEREDIAIIGMGCKFSNTENYHDYWDLILNQQTTITRCPKSRIDLIRDHFPKQILKDESTFCKGSFIEDIEMFDHDAFSMTYDEACAMSPGHRMMLQAAYRTLEDAGYLGEKGSGNKTGVFIGNNYTKDTIFSYALMSLHNSNYNFTFDNMLNTWTSGIATKVANIFDLHGGAYAIDASCPSSTFAIANACQALRSRQCTTALAGGLLVDMSPIKRYNNSGWIFLHEDDIITRDMDNDPGGAYIAEGAAAVLLKPLAQALEDGDTIHGIICGHSVNSNGANGTFTQSSVEDIKKLVVSAAKNAQIDINDTAYLEGEGYPNKVESGLELSGLAAGFSQLTEKKQFCGLGSISANVGYLQSAIGVFNLIKLTLAMKHKTIPPQYHFIEPSDMVNLVKSPFYISDLAKEWKTEGGKPRQCAMYSYGYGGNNVMFFLQEAPETKYSAPKARSELFVLSAKSETAFDNRIKSMIGYLAQNECDVSLAELCYTASVCRPSYSRCRMAVIARSPEELLEKLVFYVKNQKLPLGMQVNKRGEDNADKKRKQNRLSPKEMNLEEVAEGYCEGMNYWFAELFEEEKPRQLDIPQYIFDKKRCWSEKQKLSFSDKLKMILGKSERKENHG